MALPKKHRLKHRQEFSAVYQAGLRRSSAHLTLRALRHTAKPDKFNTLESDAVSAAIEYPTQIGISVSQKVSKRAVVRNRIRRRLQAAFQQFLPHLSPGWRLVVVVRPSATQCDYWQFLQELKQLLMDAEVLDGY
jgi:ribonuclease P protein component